MRRLPGRADAASRLGRGRSPQALAGLGLDTGVDVDALWRAAELVDEHIGDEPVDAARAADRGSRRAAAGSRRGRRRRRRAAARAAAGDRLDEVLDELERVRVEPARRRSRRRSGRSSRRRRSSTCSARTATQTVVDELRELVDGRFGTPPGPIDATVRRAVELLGGGAEAERAAATSTTLREQPQGLAASEEELLLLALFGEEAERLLRTIRARAQAARRRSTAGGVEQAASERIRAVVRIVQETGVDEITVEEGGMRVSVRRTRGAAGVAPATEPPPAGELEEPAARAPAGRRLRARRGPMVGTFYRASEPARRRSSRRATSVEPGQTLCILEAMKLMNQIKAEIEGIVREIHVAERRAGRVRPAALRARAAVRPAARRALGAADAVQPRARREPRRGRRARDPRAARARRSRRSRSTRPPTRDALHVRLADRAVCIGPPPAARELPAHPVDRRGGRRRRGCDAVHPGYGFLAENPAFVEACADNDLVFVGPRAGVMDADGRQGRARRRDARPRACRLVPGTDGPTTVEAARGGRATRSATRCC